MAFPSQSGPWLSNIQLILRLVQTTLGYGGFLPLLAWSYVCGQYSSTCISSALGPLCQSQLVNVFFSIRENKTEREEKNQNKKKTYLSIHHLLDTYIHTIWNLAPIPLGTTTTLLWKKQRRKNAFAINTQVKKIRDFKNNNVCAIDIWINTT